MGDNQPYWAQSLLRKRVENTDVEEVPVGVRPTCAITSRTDIHHLVHLGDGGGVVVDEQLLKSYSGAREDISGLIREGVVRHVQRQEDDVPGQRRRVKKDVQESVDDFPLGA